MHKVCSNIFSVSFTVWANVVSASGGISASAGNISSFQWLVQKWAQESMQARVEQEWVCWEPAGYIFLLYGSLLPLQSWIWSCHLAEGRAEKIRDMEPEPQGSIEPQTHPALPEPTHSLLFKSFWAACYCKRVISMIYYSVQYISFYARNQSPTGQS